MRWSLVPALHSDSGWRQRRLFLDVLGEVTGGEVPAREVTPLDQLRLLG